MQTRWRAAAVVAGVLVTGAVVVAVVRPWADTGAPLPVAKGRSTDACAARGPVGIVGYDLATGARRWTNVVGEDVQNLWTAGPDGDVTSGDDDHAYVIDGAGHVRRIVAATGAVDQCPDLAEMPKEAIGRPIAVDATGAHAVEEILHRVDLREADGRNRWQRPDLQLIGASTGGVVVWTNPQTTCCDSGSGDQHLAVLDPASGETRWTGGDPSGVLAVTAEHVITMAVTDEDTGPAPGGERDWRITAFDLADGTAAWHLDRTAFGVDVRADAGTAVLTWWGVDGAQHLSVLDEADGRERWSVVVPEPGRGGDATAGSSVTGAAVAGEVLVVAVESAEPYRD